LGFPLEVLRRPDQSLSISLDRKEAGKTMRPQPLSPSWSKLPRRAFSTAVTEWPHAPDLGIRCGTWTQTREGEMELEFAGFVALVLMIAGLAAPVPAVRLAGASLDETVAAMAAAHCAVTADNEASYYFTGAGQGLIELVPAVLRNDGADCQR
jgi:hypothetical protein